MAKVVETQFGQRALQFVNICSAFLVTAFVGWTMKLTAGRAGHWMARVSFRQAVQDRSHRIVVERDDTLSGFRLASFNGQRGVDEVGGRNALAEALHKASLFFRYPLTSEFYGEAMVALKQVSEGIDVLLDEDKTKAEAIAQAIKRQSFPRP